MLSATHLNILASFKFSLHFLDITFCLVPMLQRWNEKAITVKSVNYF